MRSFVFSSGARLCGNRRVVCLPHAYDRYVAFCFYAVQHLVVPSHVDHSYDARRDHRCLRKLVEVNKFDESEKCDFNFINFVNCSG